MVTEDIIHHSTLNRATAHVGYRLLVIIEKYRNNDYLAMNLQALDWLEQNKWGKTRTIKTNNVGRVIEQSR